MRVEPYDVGSYVHVVKRGARGLPIVRDDEDRWRFLRMLFLLNDKHFHKDWVYLCNNEPLFFRPKTWQDRQPIVEIHVYTLMPNHFHLLLKEVVDGGISKFMQKLGQSMTNFSNEKYQEKGSLFQGAYKSRTVDIDEYLRYVAAYIMVKNTFELYPKGGLDKAQKNFSTAWRWAVEYNFSSIGDYYGLRKDSPVLAENTLENFFTPQSFKMFALDMIKAGKWTHDRENRTPE